MGTTNAILGSESSRFQYQFVIYYLACQAELVREYKKSEEFTTQNFDFNGEAILMAFNPR